jgi:gliding motility-associated-like protein
MKLYCTSFVIASFFFLSKAYSQSVPCPFVNAGPDQTADCSAAAGCSNLAATFLELNETTSYTVESIPHAPPIAYNLAGGTGVSVNTDDVWSGVINIPFPFCFYGVTYNSMLIGSNGNLNFTTTNASGYCPWAFTASCPSTNLTAAGNVFGIYHDIDPSVCGNIKYYITGSAPCRQLVVSYDQICHFSCTSIKSRHMMVLNETTNYIDVYVESKPLCSGWNAGNAIIGLQNPAGTAGITAPGRNTAPDWTVTTPEGWRFKPAGTPLYTIEWFQAATSLGTTADITVCPSTATTYIAQFTYTKCGSTTPTVLTDDVTITPAPGAISASITPQQSTCGQANGTVSITATGGSGTLSYSSDNVTFGPTTNFNNLSAGTYTFYVQDQGGCSVSIPVQITDLSTLAATSTSQQSICGQANGSVSISASGGTGTLTYSSDNITFISSSSFSGLLPGNYTFYVKDQNGCLISVPVQITDLSTLAATADSIPALCSGSTDGSISVTATGGTQPYSYILGTGSPQINAIFNNLSAGNYSLTIIDDQGCQVTLNQSVTEPTAIQLTEVSTTNSSCNLPNGGLEVSASGGISPYTFSIDNFTTNQVSGQFLNISASTYVIEVNDQNGCSTQINVVVNGDNSVTAIPGNTNQPSCFGLSDGGLNISTFGGPSPYQFSINNGAFGIDSVFTNLSAGTYLLTAQDANGCIDTVSMTIGQPTLLVSNAGTPVTVCTGTSVTLTGSATGGTPPYSYVWNGTSQNPLTYVADSTQMEQLIVTDVNGCISNNQVITTVLPLPIANATCSPTTGGVPLQVTTSNQSQFANSYNWDFGNGSTQQTVDLSSVNTNYANDGTFIIELTASNGICQDVWYYTIVVIPVLPLEVDVPNVFTPNADGSNEGYSVWTKNAASIEAVIVNRWGNTMVIIDDLNYQWDGKTPNGTEASPGVYFLKYKVIGLDATEVSGHTFFHLIR